MRIEDAPPAGWYPDPEGGARLRWWEGTDWADRWRAPTTPGAIEIGSSWSGQLPDDLPRVAGRPSTSMGSLDRATSEEIIAQVRMAARQEAERAAELFGAQARAATQNLQPLIGQYTSKITRWIRILSVVAVVLLIAWIAWQLFVQVSLFEWIGDRIDNVTGDADASIGLAGAPVG